MGNDENEITQITECSNTTKVSVSVQNFEVLQTGSIIIPGNLYVEFHVGDLFFRFKYNPNITIEQPVDVSVEEDDKKIMTLTFTSLGDIGETSTKSPLELATIDKKKIFISFIVKPFKGIGEASNLLMHYTWLKEK